MTADLFWLVVLGWKKVNCLRKWLKVTNISFKHELQQLRKRPVNRSLLLARSSLFAISLRILSDINATQAKR